MNDDKTSPRESGAVALHRLMLRGAAIFFMGLGAVWLLLVVLPFATRGGLSPIDILEQGVFGAVPVGVGMLLYKVAPHLMD